MTVTAESRPRVLLTVSGAIPDALEDEIACGVRPRTDYLELAKALGGAEVLDRTRARKLAGPFGRFIESVLGPDFLMAWVCFRLRMRFSDIFTDGEQIGLPFASLCRLVGRRPRHHMIVHRLSVPKKSVPFRLLGLGHFVDTFVTYATSQTRFLTEKLRVDAERVVQTTFMVDTRFFSADRVAAHPSNMICAVGLECRDYPTFIEAIEGLDVRVVIAAASPWSKRTDTTRAVPLPPNVEVCQLNPVQLRQLYADSRFLVMPLFEVDFQAGVTSLLEAMAMGKAVVCSRTAGQTDVVREGETGIYVPPADRAALRRAIEELLADPDRARRLGSGGRRYVSARCDVGDYADRLGAVVTRTGPRAGECVMASAHRRHPPSPVTMASTSVDVPGRGEDGQVAPELQEREAR
jgi:glycosyltransferase involved in cell wall biosynthesis